MPVNKNVVVDAYPALVVVEEVEVEVVDVVVPVVVDVLLREVEVVVLLKVVVVVLLEVVVVVLLKVVDVVLPAAAVKDFNVVVVFLAGAITCVGDVAREVSCSAARPAVSAIDVVVGLSAGLAADMAISKKRRKKCMVESERAVKERLEGTNECGVQFYAICIWAVSKRMSRTLVRKHRDKFSLF